MKLRVESMPDDPRVQAFLYGPVVLAGDLGAEGLTPPTVVGPMAPKVEKTGAPGVPTFRASGDPASWIKPADKPLAFRTTGQKRDVSLVPLSALIDRRYSVYWQVSA